MSVDIRIGHVLDRLAEIPDESISCVWTSVPYFGLRSYGTEPQVWGGDPDHAHDWQDASWRPARWGALDDDTPGDKQRTNSGSLGFRGSVREQRVCHCGAWRGEHGLEPSLQLWLKHEVLIWRDIRRVLRPEGCAWLNVGDAYASDGGAGGGLAATGLGTPSRATTPRPETTDGAFRRWEKDYSGLKPKQRLMLPARLALSLQEDGWWLRDEIVWHKPNPMPSSVGDRTTPAHEMLYLLTKSARYFFDGHAIREPFSEASVARLSQKTVMSQEGGVRQDQFAEAGLNNRSNSRRPNEIVQGLAQRITRRPAGWDTADGGHSTLRHAASRGATAGKFGDETGGGTGDWEGHDRNKRSVWTITTEPMKEAHFAVAPTKLIEPCILAGTSAYGVCATCGAPWVRVTDEPVPTGGRVSGNKERKVATGGERSRTNTHIGSSVPWAPSTVATVSWRASCSCETAETVPATVLDPFGGSGTTALVAEKLGRDCILIELNPDYAKMADRRCRSPGLALA